MNITETTWYKYLDGKEYKVTLADGRVIKSKQWQARWDDENNTAYIPHVYKKIETRKRK